MELWDTFSFGEHRERPQKHQGCLCAESPPRSLSLPHLVPPPMPCELGESRGELLLAFGTHKIWMCS